MCKEVDKYAEKYAKEKSVKAIKILIEQGASSEMVLAAYPEISKDEIQGLFNEFVSKNS